MLFFIFMFRQQRDPRNRSVEYFLERIVDFNSLYYKFERDENYERLERFQTFLDIYGTEDNETYYDILKVVKMVNILKDFLSLNKNENNFHLHLHSLLRNVKIGLQNVI